MSPQPLGQTRPILHVRAAFDDDPGDTVTIWHDITGNWDRVVDEFDGSTVDTSMWTLTQDADTPVTVSGGSLRFTNDGDAGLSYIQSNMTYDLTGGQVTMHAPTLATMAGDTQRCQIQVQIDNNNLLQFLVYMFGSTRRLFVYQAVGGSATNLAVVNTTELWEYLRIRFRNGRTYFDASVDGAAWQTITDVADPIAITALTVRLLAGPSGASTAYTHQVNWVEIAQYMNVPRIETCEIHRGRQNELARDDAGAAIVVLENQDRDLDPLNEDGIYYPNVDLLRRVQIILEWDSIEYKLYQGFIDSPDPDFRDNGTVTFLSLACSDGLASLNLFPVTSSTAYPAELSGARIGRILDAIGWPAGERRIDAGIHTVRAETPEELPDGTMRLDLGDAKSYLQKIADAEGGRFFIGGDGYAVFQDRRHRVDDETISQASFTDAEDPTGIQYENTPIVFDTGNLYNDVTYKLDDGNVEHCEDTPSVTRYRRRNLGMGGPLQRPGEAFAAASLELLRRKSPLVRLPSITVMPAGAEWETILPLLGDLSKRVTVRRAQFAGTPIEIDCYVEGFRLKIGRDVTVSLELSPVQAPFDEWVLGTSALGTDTYIGV